MGDRIIIQVPGQPVPKARARVTKRGFAFTPAKTRSYEAHVSLAAKVAMAGRAPITEAVAVDVVAWMPIPTSWPKWKFLKALNGLLYHTFRPDVDNLAKSGLDACNGIVWKDDCQIVDLRIRKAYGQKPSLSIQVRIMQNLSEPIDGQ